MSPSDSEGNEQPRAGRSEAKAREESGEKLVGVLSEQAHRRCLSGFKEEWIDPYFEVGFTKIVLEAKTSMNAFKALLDRPIILSGRGLAGFPGPNVKHKAPCPEMQMRNDWVMGKNGVRLRRSKPAGVVSYPAFKAERIQPFDGLSARVDKGTVVVSLKNTFVQRLPGVAITLHYEGCYGKPNVRRATRSVGELWPGKTASESFPAYDVVPGRRPLTGGKGLVHRAFSIQVTTSSKHIIFDLDARLSRLVGNPPLCPSRKK